MKDGQGFILVYSVVAENTFHTISDFREKILRAKGTPMVVSSLLTLRFSPSSVLSPNLLLS